MMTERPPARARARKDADRQAGLDPSRRAVLAALTKAGLTLKQGSRALGRNDAYLQQYLYRGSPRRLPEDVRLRLADLTGERTESFLDPQLRSLHGSAAPSRLPVPLLDVSAAAGGAASGMTLPVTTRPLPSANAAAADYLGADQQPATDHDQRRFNGAHLEDGDMVMVDTGRTSPSPPGISSLMTASVSWQSVSMPFRTVFRSSCACHPTIRPTAITSAASTRSASLAVLLVRPQPLGRMTR